MKYERFCDFLVGESSSGISRDEFIEKIAKEVLGKLPAEFEMFKIRKKYGLDVAPTTIVLLQELERFNILIGRMRRSLATLMKVGILFLCIVEPIFKIVRAFGERKCVDAWDNLKLVLNSSVESHINCYEMCIIL